MKPQRCFGTLVAWVVAAAVLLGVVALGMLAWAVEFAVGLYLYHWIFE